MYVVHSKDRPASLTRKSLSELLNHVAKDRLYAFVDMLSFPRHYEVERKANVRARDLLLKSLQNMGYRTAVQGSYDNIVATSDDAFAGSYLLLGAHYDSVPGTPGADDNGSAVAACLECARLLREARVGKTMFIFFNREEDGLLGSTEFVAYLMSQSTWSVREAHIFEMVGYCTRKPNSQGTPPGLPTILTPNRGDFLALLANQRSNTIAERLLALAASYLPSFPVLALKLYLGIEKLIPHLHRSDHAPFWTARIPSLMWTDTADFRNPHYHRDSDLPATLDYEFLAQVTRLALARAASC